MALPTLLSPYICDGSLHSTVAATHHHGQSLGSGLLLKHSMTVTYIYIW